MLKKTRIFIVFTLLCVASLDAPAKIISSKNLKSRGTSKRVSVIPPSEQKAFNGSFYVASNYMFRGISQTDNLPALQGIITYTFLPTPFYLGFWGSNVCFDDGRGHTATVELDAMAGITNKIGEHFSYNMDIEEYIYPNAQGQNYNEFVAYLTYYFLTGLLGYSNNVYNTGKNGTYYNLGVEYNIPAKYIYFDQVNISGWVGHYDLPQSKGLNSYNDYSLQLTKTLGRYLFSLQWTDTNGRSTYPGALDNSHVLGKFIVNF